MRTYREIGDMIRQSWQRQQAVRDKRARDFINVMTEEQDYDDAQSPTGRTRLPMHYDQAWRLNDGTYVMTNDPSFNPYKALGIDGEQLVQSR
jgi:hypothetical protein